MTTDDEPEVVTPRPFVPDPLRSPRMPDLPQGFFFRVSRVPRVANDTTSPWRARVAIILLRDQCVVIGYADETPGAIEQAAYRLRLEYFGSGEMQHLFFTQNLYGDFR